MKSRNFIGMGAALGSLALVAVPLSASATVDLYESIGLGDLGGDRITVSSSRSSMPSGWNDTVSSLWVWNPVNYIRIYEHENYQGENLQFISGTDSLGTWGFNDKTSSYIIVNNP